MKQLIKNLGLVDKVKKYAKDLISLKKERREFYDYYSNALDRLYKISNKDEYDFEVESLRKDLYLFKNINPKYYDVLSNVYVRVVQRNNERFKE